MISLEWLRMLSVLDLQRLDDQCVVIGFVEAPSNLKISRLDHARASENGVEFCLHGQDVLHESHNV